MLWTICNVKWITAENKKENIAKKVQLKRTNVLCHIYTILCDIVLNKRCYSLRSLDNSCLRPGWSVSLSIKYVLCDITHLWIIRMHLTVCDVFRIFDHQIAFYFMFPRSLFSAYYTQFIRLRKIIKISVKKFWKFNSYKNSFLIHLELSLRRCTDTLIYCAIRS